MILEALSPQRSKLLGGKKPQHPNIPLVPSKSSEAGPTTSDRNPIQQRHFYSGTRLLHGAHRPYTFDIGAALGRDVHSQSSQSCFQLCKVHARETGAVQELFCRQSSTQAGEEQGRGILTISMLDMDQRERITKNDSTAEMSAIRIKCFMLHALRFLKLNSE